MRDSRLDDLETCPDCGKLTEYDPCSGEPHASEGFDRCDCEEAAVSVAQEEGE